MKVNLAGRTQKQQNNVEAKVLKSGSLWPNFDVVNKFIFTRKELNAIKKANEIIEQHKVKCLTLKCT